MKTTKPFSTISYNSSKFLQLKLDELVRKRVISFYAFIKHFAESDERKDHNHLFVIPNGQVQTDSLTDILFEFDPFNPLKPFGVMPWRSSKFADWYLYSCHDVGYLASKGQARTHHYQESDFICSDTDYLHELVTTIDRSKYLKTQDFVNKVKKGESFLSLLQSGQIPAPQFNAFFNMYNFLTSDSIFRNGRFSHSPAIDKTTGEIIYKDDKDDKDGNNNT